MTTVTVFKKKMMVVEMVTEMVTEVVTG